MRFTRRAPGCAPGRAPGCAPGGYLNFNPKSARIEETGSYYRDSGVAVRANFPNLFGGVIVLPELPRYYQARIQYRW